MTTGFSSPNLKTFFIKHQHSIFLLLIILIGLFFRTYDLVNRLEFAHDGDLQAWIVKDIIVNKHIRLIGQLTSADGIFIGPFYYYLLIPFYLLTNMDPIGATIPIIIISILTIVSYYFVFAKLFKKEIGLIIAFFQAILIPHVLTDRSVVPTVTTPLWSIWYFYSIILLSRGKFQALPLLAILIALIWHVHIALLPSLLAIPVAFLVSKKFPNLKLIIISIISFLLVSIPFILFELKHHFSQSHSLITNFTTNHGGGHGVAKFGLVLTMISQNLSSLIFYHYPLPINNIYLFLLLFISGLFLVKKSLLRSAELISLYAWIFGVIIFFSISSSPISEYYFANTEVIFLGFVSFLIYILWKLSKFSHLFVLISLSIVLLRSLFTFLPDKNYHIGYNERRATANYIFNDSRQKNYPCIAVSYITSPGENVGFRYFFYLKGLHVNQSGSNSPDYTIVLPEELATSSATAKFGHIGIIPPQKVGTKSEIDYSCSGQNANLTDPMFGYTE